jgi:hypothetical protein
VYIYTYIYIYIHTYIYTYIIYIYHIHIYLYIYTNELSWFPQFLKSRSFGVRNRSLGHQLADLGLAQILHGTHLPGAARGCQATVNGGLGKSTGNRGNPKRPLKNIGLFGCRWKPWPVLQFEKFF